MGGRTGTTTEQLITVLIFLPFPFGGFLAGANSIAIGVDFYFLVVFA